MQAIKLDKQKDSEYSVFPESQERERERDQKKPKDYCTLLSKTQQDECM